MPEYKREFRSRHTTPRVYAHHADDGRTHQDQAADADINRIVGRFLRTGHISHVQPGTPLFGDFTDVADFQTQLDRIEAAREAFESLPARVRAIADNDPGRFLEIWDDPDYREDLEAAGLDFSPPQEAHSLAEGQGEPSSGGSADPSQQPSGAAAPTPPDPSKAPQQ